jgi:hypothetical protein
MWLWILQGILTILFSILIIFGKRLLNTLDNLVASINAMEKMLAGNNAQCNVTHKNIDQDLQDGKNRMDMHDKVLSKHDHRITVLETKIDK